MRIAILADPLDNQRAGVHTYTREVINALIRLNSKHEIILIREKIDPKLKDIKQISVPNVHLPIGFSSFRLFLWIPYIVRKNKIDIVIEPAHFGPFNLPRKIKRVTMIHDLTPILFAHYHRYHSQLFQRIFLKRILKNADLILSNSKNTQEDINKVYPFTKNKVKTILLGKDPSYKPDTHSEIIKKYDINAQYFLNVGTIEPRKDLLTLLKAYALFRKENPEYIKLVIVGQLGWKSEAFSEALASHPYKNDIILPGYVEQEHMSAIYTQALSLIYPSEYEGFGLPILEALSCGTHVICSDNSSLPEVGGALAYYFETHNAEELNNQMLKVMSNQSSKGEFSKKAIEWSDTFSWDKHAKELIKQLEILNK